MSIIAAREYRDGKPIGDVQLGGEVSAKQSHKPSDFSWTGPFEPTPEEINACAKTYSLQATR